MRTTKPHQRRHHGCDRLNSMAAQHGVFVCPGVSGNAVLFDAATGKELGTFWRKSRLLYMASLPARRVRSLSAAVRLAGELRKVGAA